MRPRHVIIAMVVIAVLAGALAPATHVTGETGPWQPLEETPEFSWLSVVYLTIIAIVVLSVLGVIVTSTLLRRRASPRDPLVEAGQRTIR